MKPLKPTCRLAVVQAEPKLFDKEAGLQQTLLFIRRAAAQGAELIVFPELFIPGYPFGMNFGFSTAKRTPEGRADWQRYYEASILVPGPETEAIGAAAKEAGAWVSIGVSERDERTGTLYNSNLIFSPEGEVVSAHRKLKPTGSERVVWGDADRGFFPMAETPWGPVASLICWESYMPLARVALYQKGLTIYLSPNTNDNPEWQDMAYKGKWREAAYTLLSTNNFPEFTGRICPALCEKACVLGHSCGQSVTCRENEVAIIERAFSEGYIEPHIPAKRTGKKGATSTPASRIRSKKRWFTFQQPTSS